MKILVLGGTRYFGVHLVNELLKKGYDVTIATRGIAKDTFGQDVKRLFIERTNYENIKNILQDKYFDIIYDNLAYCSNDVKYLLDNIQPKRYIMTSTMSVYKALHAGVKESEFNPLTYNLKWCSREDYTYGEAKRQAECALFQEYPQTLAAAVRFPYVIGEDDYTKRLYSYVEHILIQKPMYIDNLDEKLGFIGSKEAGCFLAWLATQDFTGTINGSNSGTISMREVIDYVERMTGKKAIILPESESAPYNHAVAYSLDTSIAEELGYKFSDLDSWIYKLINSYIKSTKFKI